MFETGHRRTPRSRTGPGAPRACAAGGIVSGARVAPPWPPGGARSRTGVSARRACCPVLACRVAGSAAFLPPTPPSLNFTQHSLHLIFRLGRAPLPFLPCLFTPWRVHVRVTGARTGRADSGGRRITSHLSSDASAGLVKCARKRRLGNCLIFPPQPGSLCHRRVTRVRVAATAGSLHGP